IWSGMNLAYHLNRNHNIEEAKFFDNILSYLVNISKPTVPTYNVEFSSSNLRTITTQNAKGILFKEQAYDGWKANFIGNKSSGSISIFKAGPAYPGFMYIPL